MEASRSDIHLFIPYSIASEYLPYKDILELKSIVQDDSYHMILLTPWKFNEKILHSPAIALSFVSGSYDSHTIFF